MGLQTLLEESRQGLAHVPFLHQCAFAMIHEAVLAGLAIRCLPAASRHAICARIHG